MYFGADYYPEHWPEERWRTDAELMKEAHFNFTRTGEFDWAKIEPEKGRYDFGWLDRAVDTLGKAGIRVVMGTPTGAPPKWLIDAFPRVLPVDPMGHVKGFGTRMHCCHNSPEYIELSREIVRKVAEHYKDNEYVVGWEIDIELGGHDSARCYCDSCRKAFQNWLRAKYGTVDWLNKAWGTVFWSQTYSDFGAVILPAFTLAEATSRHVHNPGLMLDYYRFASDSFVRYLKMQCEEIRRVSDKSITHNMLAGLDSIDYSQMSKQLDIVSWDNYPSTEWGLATYQKTAWCHDQMRGYKNANFWMLEQQSGPCGWNIFGDTPKPGQLRLWAYQSIAHGAEAVAFFRWRACLFGTEQNWYGILDHDGIPRRRYRELQKMGAELIRLSDYFAGSEYISEVAVVRSFDHLWSSQIQRQNDKFDYDGYQIGFHSALTDHNIPVDVVGYDGELLKYKLVILPAFTLMSEQLAEKFKRYVSQGGTIIVTFLSGTRNFDNSMTELTVPGYFRELLGIEVEEFDSLNRGRQVPVKGVFGCGRASMWCDVVSAAPEKALAVYDGEYYKGKAAVTVNHFGKGSAYYIACDLDSYALHDLLSIVAEKSGVNRVLKETSPGVEVVKKARSGLEYIMVLNHNAERIEIDTEDYKNELITQERINGRLSLDGYGVAILSKD